MKILFITNVPSPYRVDFFNELSKYCEVTVCFERHSSSERSSKWKSGDNYHFESVFLKGIKAGVDSAACPGVLKYLKKNKYDYIVVCGISTPTTMLAIMHLKLHKIPYYIECDGGIPKKAGGIKEKIKKKLVPGAEGYFSTGKLNDEYLLQYGVKKESIIRYPFTSYHEAEIPTGITNKTDKLSIRKQLEMNEEKIVISVGRFSYLGGYGKGYDVLLKAAQVFPNNTGVYIIGDDPTEEFLKMKDELKLDNVHFVGFKSKTELVEYYKAADIFVLMTVSDVWGLVINEAMSHGLPVITTNLCGAGVELIEDGKNGYVISVGDTEQLSERANRLLERADICEQMGKLSHQKIQAYTIENMVSAHAEHFEEKRKM